jgi:hypothetical protein
MTYPLDDKEVHLPFTDDGVTYCGWDLHEGCGEVWPCTTIRERRKRREREQVMSSMIELDAYKEHLLKIGYPATEVTLMIIGFRAGWVAGHRP